MKKAMILAAGMGTRLGEITLERPKILVDIGGITLIEWIVGKLLKYGFNDIIINVHHHADMIEETAKELGKRLPVTISISDERKELLDTGGGLYRARDFFGDDPFLLYNGDIVTDLDLENLYSLNCSSGAIATLALRNRPGNRFFLVDDQGNLGGWRNRESGKEIIIKPGSEKLNELAFSAVSVLNPEIFNYMTDGVYSMRPVYLDAAKNNVINSLLHDRGVWVDIGSVSQLENCRQVLNGVASPSDLF